MAIFTNQATLIYNGQSTSSNVTTGEILNGISLTKTAITATYGRNDHVAYVVTISNNGGSITNATLTDDLGAYISAGGLTLTPLTYVAGSLLYYVNGVPTIAPTVTAGPPLTVTGIDIPAGENVVLIYEAATNEYTPPEVGSEITNTASLTGSGLAEPVTDTATVTAAEEVALTIAKAMCPPVVNDNDTLTYTFIIQNAGNTPIVATDNVIVTDTFNPILNPIEVRFNGTLWTEGVEYNYDEATGLFTTTDGSITVPAATYTQDVATGVYSTTPGVAVITVTGTV